MATQAADQAYWRRARDTLVSALCGALLGATAGFYGPFVLAVWQDEDPFHVGSYGVWVLGLMTVLPISMGVALSLLTWQGRWKTGIRVTWLIAAAVLVWQTYLTLT